jgi:hypothetical protein
MAIEIVDFPIQNGGSFRSASPQGVGSAFHRPQREVLDELSFLPNSLRSRDFPTVHRYLVVI